MPEPQNENQPTAAEDDAAQRSAARERAQHEHEDVLAALVGADDHDDHTPAVEPEPESHARAGGDGSAVGATEAAAADDDAAAGGAAAPGVQYGVGPFSIREVVIGGVWLVAFVVSFFSILPAQASFTSVWTEGINWILTIAVPTVAVFLLVLRRLSPTGIRRVGSLGIDQFASVAFSVAAVVWITLAWESVMLTARYAAASGYSWVVWVESVLMVAGVVLTVFAPLIPVFAQDFQGRPEAPAHRLARPVRPVAQRPRPVRPAPVAPTAVTPQTPAAAPVAVAAPAPAPAVEPERTREPEPAEPVAADTTVMAAASADAETRAVPTATQAFWALVPEQRDVVDATGTPLFSVGPTAWALVIEERADGFVVRHEDGRVGYLRDTSGVTRG
ncbi:hypothetical protein [Microbacterium mangrovi]|uniref:hypothetical protein n=1 Tax=Microbacterium mangrovi TaxID=1348253 RepID=UPI000AC7776A|nr:hypothetical protein [Microbacterium mangrovi]